MLDAQTLHRITKRAVAEIIDEKEFIALLQEGKPLRLKMGFDPSRPDIHLGHVVGLRKLRQLQDLGHQVILIVGDWTAQIGDPSGQSATRPMLTHEEVVRNAESYMRQFFKVVDRARTQAVWQSEWFGKFTLADVIRLTSKFTVAQLLHRDDFWKRWEAERPIALTELLYPLLQAYDSVAIRADVEFGGTDQKFNLLVGRQLQGMVGQRPQQCFLVPLLVGTDGVQKMSKSLNNYIGVEEPPREQFGKIMSLPDALIIPYFELLTDVPDQEITEMRHALERQEVNPMLLKKRLGREIVTQFWGPDAAREAQTWFETVFQRREVPADIPTIPFRQEGGQWVFFTPGGVHRLPAVNGEVETADLLYALGLAPSKSQAKRLLAQGSVEVEGVKTTAERLPLRDGTVLRVGKRRFARLVLHRS
ncbi:MAG: tyrosine--tRNA ligase [Dehalococcoidia bacterium]|nr:tyrosine--tRNA ligase [Dehalococcoidia bacterium]MDW8120168.1 tyrosine--tRNA ligase [Chloroflexota bacterium]